MGKLKIEFHPIFILFAFCIVYFGWAYEFLIYFVVLCLHESAHYFVAKRLGYTLNKVVFMPYGVGIGGKSTIFKPRHEIMIALAGPIFNLILAVVCIALWWIVPLSYGYTDTFVVSNLCLGIFNMLPLFPLDGGRVLVCLLSDRVKRVKVYKIMKILGFIFSAIFVVLFVVSVFFHINLTLFFIAVFIFSSCFGNDVNIYFERTQVANFSNNVTNPMQVKMYAIDKKTPVYKLVKFIGSNNYTMFCVVDNNKVVRILTENEIANMLKK